MLLTLLDRVVGGLWKLKVWLNGRALQRFSTTNDLVSRPVKQPHTVSTTYLRHPIRPSPFTLCTKRTISFPTDSLILKRSAIFFENFISVGVVIQKDISEFSARYFVQISLILPQNVVLEYPQAADWGNIPQIQRVMPSTRGVVEK